MPPRRTAYPIICWFVTHPRLPPHRLPVITGIATGFPLPAAYPHLSMPDRQDATRFPLIARATAQLHRARALHHTRPAVDDAVVPRNFSRRCRTCAAYFLLPRRRACGHTAVIARLRRLRARRATAALPVRCGTPPHTFTTPLSAPAAPTLTYQHHLFPLDVFRALGFVRYETAGLPRFTTTSATTNLYTGYMAGATDISLRYSHAAARCWRTFRLHYGRLRTFHDTWVFQPLLARQRWLACSPFHHCARLPT